MDVILDELPPRNLPRGVHRLPGYVLWGEIPRPVIAVVDHRGRWLKCGVLPPEWRVPHAMRVFRRWLERVDPVPTLRLVREAPATVRPLRTVPTRVIATTSLALPSAAPAVEDPYEVVLPPRRHVPVRRGPARPVRSLPDGARAFDWGWIFRGPYRLDRKA